MWHRPIATIDQSGCTTWKVTIGPFDHGAKLSINRLPDQQIILYSLYIVSIAHIVLTLINQVHRLTGPPTEYIS